MELDDISTIVPASSAELASTATGSAKKVFIKSFGCQMNVYDGQRMADILSRTKAMPRPRRHGRRRPDPAQHLPYPGEGGREGLFRARPLRDLKAAAGGRAGDEDRRRRLRRPGGRRGDPAPRSRRSIWSSARRPITACRPCWRRPRAGRVVDTEYAIDDKFEHLPQPRKSEVDPQARRLRLPHRAGRLRQVLHLLRRALYARRGVLAPGRADHDREASAWRRPACATSR
jgi:tRNA-2-methylthio-N6-dimethylallyladenosine synthase